MASQAFWDRLRGEVERTVAGFDGVAGVALVDLAGGQEIAVNAGEQFPAASTIKIHLLAALYDLHETGEVNLDEAVTVSPRVVGVPGSGVLAYLENTAVLTWRDIATLMIMVSDNTATNMIIDVVGFDRAQRYVEAWGLQHTVIRRHMQDHEKVARNEENLITPADTAKLLGLLHDGRGVHPGVAEACLKVLSKRKASFVPSVIPADVRVASKPGAMDCVRNDAAIVYLPRRPFILCICSKFGLMAGFEQERWLQDLAARIWQFMRGLDETSTWGQGIPQHMAR